MRERRKARKPGRPPAYKRDPVYVMLRRRANDPLHLGRMLSCTQHADECFTQGYRDGIDGKNPHPRESVSAMAWYAGRDAHFSDTQVTGQAPALVPADAIEA